mmetsp:Transcript_27383/g.78806  ORF Transcript_27383/g.78806 Transcript_27383/m.78806 type:complete len:93 (+) Transcript_27383:1931-2209(+)
MFIGSCPQLHTYHAIPFHGYTYHTVDGRPPSARFEGLTGWLLAILLAPSHLSSHLTSLPPSLPPDDCLSVLGGSLCLPLFLYLFHADSVTTH